MSVVLQPDAPTSTGPPGDPSRAPSVEERIYTAPQWKITLRRFRDHRLAVVSVLLLALLYLTAIFAEPIAPSDPQQRSARLRYAPPQRVHLFHNGHLHRPFVYPHRQHIDPESLRLSYTSDYSRPLPIRFFVRGDEYRFWGIVPTRWHLFGVESDIRLHLLGTDRLGRDLFSRIVYGARVTLFLGLVGVAMSLVLGVIIGGISGYYGGKIDYVIQRLIEVLQSFPTIPLWLALAAAIPQTIPNIAVYFFMTMILALVGWTGLARVVRGKFLALREEDYVAAARVSGVREFQIIRRHLVPGFMSHLIVHVTLAVPAMILAETSLSFLRLGLRPPTISWGVLLQDAQSPTALQLYPWLLMPAAFVVITALAFNFVGDGLRDAVDPHMS
jgi:peptide/nickel transport system permease protein